MVQEIIVEKSGVEKFMVPRLCNDDFLNHGVEKFMVEKSGVEKFMVEKSEIEKSGTEAWGWDVLQPCQMHSDGPANADFMHEIHHISSGLLHSYL